MLWGSSRAEGRESKQDGVEEKQGSDAVSPNTHLVSGELRSHDGPSECLEFGERTRPLWLSGDLAPCGPQERNVTLGEKTVLSQGDSVEELTAEGCPQRLGK